MEYDCRGPKKGGTRPESRLGVVCDLALLVHDGIGGTGIGAVMTVAVVFDFTVARSISFTFTICHPRLKFE